MNRRTLGYIVVGGDETPLRWYPSEGRFYTGIFKDRPSVSVFRPDAYGTARRAIRNHYIALDKQTYTYSGHMLTRFSNLRIVRLTDALGFI